jgi:hypothetical protein
MCMGMCPCMPMHMFMDRDVDRDVHGYVYECVC